MAARILDGEKIAAAIKAEVAEEVKTMSAAGVRPGLAVILCGNNPASEIYVRGKVKSCEMLGIYSEKHTPPDTSSTDELLALVHDLNTRDEIDGVLVQLPLPAQVDSKRVLMAVDPAKDVDGFHPVNIGYLSSQRPGLAAHQQQRYCDHLSLQNARPARRVPPRRHPGVRHGTHRHDRSEIRATGRHRD